jgi:hypothetical protein
LQISRLPKSGAGAPPGNTRRVVVPLAGAAILVGFGLASLPRLPDLFRGARTPFDRSAARSGAPVFALLSQAARVLPAGASVVVRTEPPDAARETEGHRFGVALLPGRTVLPASEYGRFLPREVWSRAEYEVVLGGRPAVPPGRLLIETGDGTVWRRSLP